MIYVLGSLNIYFTASLSRMPECGETHKIDEELKNAGKGDILVTQLEIPHDRVLYALRLAKQKGMTTILIPAPAAQPPNAIFENTDIIVTDETETQILTGVEPRDIVHIALAVKAFYKMGVKKVVFTLGKRGTVCAEGQEITELDIPSSERNTFVGALAVKLDEGLGLIEACKYANSTNHG
ncbi:MAG: PfkB family carbohydrate kinase [Firmicutes bacterium]|nr:PfkB family carbohydrate kinase [Bacillota bacterium]